MAEGVQQKQVARDGDEPVAEVAQRPRREQGCGGADRHGTAVSTHAHIGKVNNDRIVP